ncbi:hypothetical protein [Herpetosiphon llansteffanensis]|uniref:hypothetical protein n=1 Tax=Herpetosiphon llansteffanensis TaxID=2094568 RepID=UPI000D7CF687|nr:hypothetical protein [Herpetosiphon llansteffanensis]
MIVGRLPDVPLDADLPMSASLISQGLEHYQAVARWIATLPFGRNTNPLDWRLVVSEKRGTSSTKHAFLAELARELALPINLYFGIYLMDGKNTPGVGQTLESNKLSAIPEAHCFLRYGRWNIDVTRSANAEPILQFFEEQQITPDQIGDYKRTVHRNFLLKWATSQGLSLTKAWAIREACMAALTHER